MSTPFFLVTGGSGYIAMHVLNQLVKQGHRIRTTVRNLKDSKKVDPIKKIAKDAKYPIEIVQADLLEADSWKNATKDITHVLHVASPLLIEVPSDENLVIKPAVEGTLNVLNASLNETVKRVVVTSSGLAVYDQPYKAKTYSEVDWPDFEKLTASYPKSKYLAEKAAWNFVDERKKNNLPCFELAYINPVFVLGPMLHDTISTSSNIFQSLFNGKLEKIPNRYYATCDVRDVAAAHIKAAFVKEAVGNRHLILSSTSPIPVKTWSAILKNEFEPKGYKIVTELEPELETYPNTKFDDSRMRNILGITPTDFKSTLLDMANNMIENGFIQPKHASN